MTASPGAVRKLVRDLAVLAAVVALYLLMMSVVLPKLGFST